MGSFPTILWIAEPPYNRLRQEYGMGFHEVLQFLTPANTSEQAQQLRLRIRQRINSHIFGLSHFLAHSLKDATVPAIRWLNCPVIDMARWVRIEAQKKHSRVLSQQRLVIGEFLLQEGFIQKEDLIQAMFLPVRRRDLLLRVAHNNPAKPEEVQYCNFAASVTLATLRHLQALGVTWTEEHLGRMVECMKQNQKGKPSSKVPSLDQLKALLATV
jgi:hypothetical protein